MAPAMFGRSAKPLSGRYLSFAEREELAILRARGTGIREIGRRLGRSASTISREIRRNAATRSGGLEYRATVAQWHAERAARRPKPAKLASNAALRTYVQERLAGMVAAPGGAAVPGPTVCWKGRRHGPRQDRRWAKAWSPQQIAHRLRLDFPGDATMRISHEAIYQSLYVQGRGALRRELTACLRTGRALRVPRERTRGRGKSFIVPAVMISERPAEAADRAVPGHWEGDLILGLNRSAIGTLVERTTRFTMLLHLPPMDGHGCGPRAKNGPALAGHGAEAVLAYLSRYTHRVAISDRRLLAFDKTGVTFGYKDYRCDDGKRQRVMTLAADEFIRRYLLHLLPRGFHRIRHYGLLASSARKANLARARELLAVTPPPTDKLPDKPREMRSPCPCCGGAMIVVDIFARWCQPRAPPHATYLAEDVTP